MRLLSLTLLLFLTVTAFAKKPAKDYYSYFNTDAFWQKLVEDVPGAPLALQPDDTAIAIASNRGIAPGTLRFMREERDADDSLRYYIAYTRDGQWHVQRRFSLRTAIASMMVPQRDWVVYTEGMGKIFTTDLDRGLGMAGQYGVNVLLLDYPSIHTGYGAYKAYRFAWNNSCSAYTDFAPALDSLKALRRAGLAGTGKLTLFFHSMGNNVMREIAQHGLLPHYNDAVWVDNVILNAPCVPRRHAARWIDSIAFARRIYVHYNPQDFTLMWARLAGFRGILGERPRKPLSRKAAYINFNPLCGRNHSNFLNLHGWWPALPEAVAHYRAVLHGGNVFEGTPDNYRVSRYRGIGKEILPQM